MNFEDLKNRINNLKQIQKDEKKIVIGNFLSSGSFGLVYNCFLNNNNNVIKIANKSDGSLFCEQRTMIFIKKNPNIYLVNMILFGTYEDLRYIVVEKYYINIEEFLKTTKLSYKVFNIILHNILNALSHLHSLNISHGDINLNNILFKNINKDSVVLIDYGMSSKFNLNNLLKIPHKYNENIQNNGNIIYSCIDIMEGYAVTPRGDLQNFGFVLESIQTPLDWDSTFPVKQILSLKKHYKSRNKKINNLINNNLLYNQFFDIRNYL